MAFRYCLDSWIRFFDSNLLLHLLRVCPVLVLASYHNTIFGLRLSPLPRSACGSCQVSGLWKSCYQESGFARSPFESAL